MSNELAGADEMQRVTVRVHEDDLEEFDGWAEETHGDRSKALRSLMKSAVGSTSGDSVTPLQLPHEEHLARGYRKLCIAANDDGVVKHERARSMCSNGPENLTKEDVDDLILRELHKRGYIKPQMDPFARSSTRAKVWRVVGWDR